MKFKPQSRKRFSDLTALPPVAIFLVLVSAAGDAQTPGANGSRQVADPEVAAVTRRVVVEVALKDMVEPLNADFVAGGIHHANDTKAAAVLLTIDTPGGLESSMRDIVQAVLESRVPVIAYVAPSGARAASAGFYILLSADVAVMAPGTHTGAAHPVILGAPNLGKTMEEKIENDAAAYLRSIAERRGRNAKLAEEGVRQSSSFTEQEALQGKLIDAVAEPSAVKYSTVAVWARLAASPVRSTCSVATPSFCETW